VVIPNHTWLKNNSNSMTPIAYLGVYIFRRFATWRILNPWILWRDTGISTIWYRLVQKCYEYPTFYDKVFCLGNMRFEVIPCWVKQTPRSRCFLVGTC
jgi:hypothetical protein